VAGRVEMADQRQHLVKGQEAELAIKITDMQGMLRMELLVIQYIQRHKARLMVTSFSFRF
jgi:hypothetical protein